MQHKRPIFPPLMTVSAVVSIAVLLGIFVFSFALGRRYTALMSFLLAVGLSTVTDWWSGGWIPTPESYAVLSHLDPSCTPLRPLARSTLLLRILWNHLK